MSAADIVSWWSLWLIVAGVVVVAAVVLLLIIIGLAHRIGGLAGNALAAAEEIEESTRPIWQINRTNRLAGELAVGAEAIAGNSEAVAQALGGSQPGAGDRS